MASAPQDMDSFVRDALRFGAARPDVQHALVHAGWPAAQARSALDAYAELDFVVPVPKPRAYLSAREAFLYLLLFSALYLSAYHLGSLLFDLINRAWPDLAQPPPWRGIEQAMRWSIASILTAFPVYLLLAYRLGRELGRNPIRRLSAVCRWLTYLTLFVTAGFLLGDLVMLLDSLLGGELTLRFVLKIGVVGAIAGSVFGYYLWDLQRDERGA